MVRGWFWFEGMVELVCGAVGRSCDVVDMGCRMGDGRWEMDIGCGIYVVRS